MEVTMMVCRKLRQIIRVYGGTRDLGLMGIALSGKESCNLV